MKYSDAPVPIVAGAVIVLAVLVMILYFVTAEYSRSNLSRITLRTDVINTRIDAINSRIDAINVHLDNIDRNLQSDRKRVQ